MMLGKAAAAVWMLATISLTTAFKTDIAERARKFRTRSNNVYKQDLQSGKSASWTFNTTKSHDYAVSSLPDIDFDFGEMYSGSIPVGNNINRTLFFVFKPKEGAPSNDLTIWLNGTLPRLTRVQRLIESRRTGMQFTRRLPPRKRALYLDMGPVQRPAEPLCVDKLDKHALVRLTKDVESRLTRKG
jgi:hypothetical protein